MILITKTSDQTRQRGHTLSTRTVECLELALCFLAILFSMGPQKYKNVQIHVGHFLWEARYGSKKKRKWCRIVLIGVCVCFCGYLRK